MEYEIDIERDNDSDILVSVVEGEGHIDVMSDDYHRIDFTEKGGYILPHASSTILGGVKIGSNLTIDVNGVLNGSPGTGGGIWSEIGGDISAQVDLMTMFALYAPLDSPSFVTQLTTPKAIISNSTDDAIFNSGGLLKNDYVSQLAGYRISAAGEADFRYLYADQLHVKSFIADLEQALAGGQIISKSVAKVAADFTIPAAGAAGSLVVEEFAGYPGYVFVDGDMIRLRQMSRSANTSLDVTDVWGTVVAVSRDATANPSTQTFTFTRSVGANAGAGTTGTIIKTGTLALDYGVSGNGYYEVTAVDGVNGVNSPYSQFVTWTGHPATGLTLKARIGNLAGITDAAFGGALSGYGLYADNVYLKGRLVIASGSSGYGNMNDKPTTLDAIQAGSGTKLAGIEALATVGATWGTNLNSIPTTLTAPSGDGLYLSSANLGFYSSGAWKTYIDNSGNMILGNYGGGGAGLSWNQTTGVLNIRGAINITSGSVPNASVAGLGSLALANSVDYSAIAGTKPPSNANYTTNTNQLTDGANLGGTATWTGVSSKPTIPSNTNQLTDGANLGGTATWSGVSSKPTGVSLFNAPSGSGLFMDGTHLGYYSSGTFQSYFDNAGNSKFVGVTEFGTNVDVYGGNVAIKGGHIWGNSGGNAAELSINYEGYQGGYSYTRNTIIYDGKGDPILECTGGDRRVHARVDLEVGRTLIIGIMNTAGRNSLPAVQGQIIFNSETNQFEVSKNSGIWSGLTTH